MAKKDFTLSSKILMSLLMLGDILFIPPREFKRRGFRGEPYGNFYKSRALVYYLAKKGFIKIVNKDNDRFIRLTKNGELEALLAKARLFNQPKKWDGKWRLIIFDIPEDSRGKRNFFRKLLKQNSFYKLQASVFISPYPLNREAIKYLKETKLYQYIRILKVEEIDDDKDLKKHFGLE